MRIILASQSQIRKELLAQMGYNVEVIVSNADETFEKNLSLEEQVKRLAYIKAKTVFEKLDGDRIVIGADTMIFKDDKVFGKPKDKEDALNMLNALKNTDHNAITGFCVLVQKDGKYKEYIDFDITKLHFKDMSENEMLNWIETRKPYDKAGSYELDSPFCVFVKGIEGNFTTVQGLPTHKVYDILKLYV